MPWLDRGGSAMLPRLVGGLLLVGVLAIPLVTPSLAVWCLPPDAGG
jgi:hypothetical protein